MPRSRTTTVALTAAIARAGNVVLGIVLDDAGSDPAPPPAPFAVEGTTEGIVPRSATGLLAPYEPLTAGAAGFGVLSFQSGLLGQVTSAPGLCAGRRRDVSRVRPGGGAGGGEGARSSCSGTNRTGSSSARSRSPSTRKAEMRLHFSPREAWAARTIPAWEILAGEGRSWRRRSPTSSC